MTLDGNFSNDGRSMSLRLGSVPVLVINGSEHPNPVSISTNDFVASNVFNFNAFASIDDDFESDSFGI